MLKRTDLDAVSICTPNMTHYEIARQVIERGIPFLLEKPIAMNGEQAEQLKQLAERKQVTNMIAFTYRYKSAIRYARQLIAEGKLGTITHMYGEYSQSFAHLDLPLIWRFSKAQSGTGALGDLGSHMLDLTRFLVGEIREVMCDAGTITKRRKRLDSDEYGEVDVDDYCHYMAKIGGGVHGVFQITRMAFGRGNYQRIEIYGSQGGLIYELDGEERLYAGDGPVGNKADYRLVDIPDSCQVDQMESFYELLAGQGDGLSATIQDGCVNQLTIDALLQSSEERRWVELPQFI